MSDSALNMSAFSIVYPLSKVIVEERRHYKERIKAVKYALKIQSWIRAELQQV